MSPQNRSTSRSSKKTSGTASTENLIFPRTASIRIVPPRAHMHAFRREQILIPYPKVRLAEIPAVPGPCLSELAFS